MAQDRNMGFVGYLWHKKGSDHRCHYCGVGLVRWHSFGEQPPNHFDPHGKGYATADHKKALSNGGDDDRSNVVLCCSVCNIRKGTMEYDKFFRMTAPERIARRLKEGRYGRDRKTKRV